MRLTIFDNVTLRFWHGGKFKHVANGDLVYMGGQGGSFQIDPDELCYWELIDLGKKCGNYKKIDGIYYLVPGLTLLNGLRKILTDAEVRDMGHLVMKHKTIDLYVLHSENEPQLSPEEAPAVQETSKPEYTSLVSQNISPPKTLKAKKLTPKRGPHKKVLSPIRRSPRKHIESAFVTKKIDTLCTSTTSKKDANTTLLLPGPTTSQKDACKASASKHAESSILTNPPTFNSPISFSKAEKTHVRTTSIDPEFQPEYYDDYEWEENRPESPLKYSELFIDVSDEDDPEFQPEFSDDDHEFEDEDGLEVEFEDNAGDVLEETDFIHDESENSDDEVIVARERVQKCNDKLLQIANQLQIEASEGRLGQQQQSNPKPVSTREGTSDGGGFVSEYEDSEDDIHTPTNSGDELEDSRRKGRRGMLVSGYTDFSKFNWKVGQRFTNRNEFKQAVAKYAIMQGRDLSFVMSNKNRQQHLGVRCVEGCPFYLYSAWHSRNATFLVRRVEDNHTCHRNMNKNRQLKSTWVAREMLEVFKARPHWPAKDIIEAVRRAYKVIVKRDFAYKVKYHAHRMLHGSMKEHYMKVGRYIEALKASSPGSTVELVVDTSKQSNPPIFQRIYTCFDGVKQGWKDGCRRVVCVDAAFLKTFLGGQILSAVGRDPNDQMFPIAWAISEGENNSSWTWFFTHLQSDLGLCDGSGITIISDEHQSIIHAVAAVLPKAEHRHCARHIFALWHKSFRGDEMKLQFWKIAKSYNTADYNEALDELNELNPEAAIAFTAYNPKLFCRAFLDCSVRTDAITNNMAETFNGYIINARTKHLIYMLEDIRVALMQRLVSKRQEAQKSTSILCPRIQAKLEKEKSKASYCDVLPSSDTLFNVKYYLDQLTVDLETRKCTCRKWDMLGVPCCHAIACMFFQNKEAESFVGECYKKEVYMKAYGGSIPPCEGERHWPRVSYSLDPPPIKIGPGRPRKNRIKDPFENPKKPGTLSRTGTEMTCSICKVKGHNKRRCPNRDSHVEQEPATKRPRGRPRLDGSAPQSQFATAQMERNDTGATPTAEHHSTTAQPTQIGRGGRVILGGRGARGGSGSQTTTTGRRSTSKGASTSVAGAGRGAAGAGRGAAKGQGARGSRGGRGGRRGGGVQVPVGVGVIIGSDGTTMYQGSSYTHRSRNEATYMPTQSNQTPSLHQQQQ